MASDGTTPRSRRALLAAAAGAAGALAAQAALPLAAAAADPNDLVLGTANQATTAETGITQATDGIVGFRVTNATSGAAALIAAVGDTTDIATDTSFTGAYGWSEADATNGLGAGLWGSSPDTGVIGTGSVGTAGIGDVGVWGFGFTGPGILGDSSTTTVPAVLARAASSTGLALQASGKVKFSRSGMTSVSSGASTKTINLSGVTSGSKVFAVFATSETGRYVRAVVPTTNSFKIYFNSALTSSAKVSWFVLD